MAQNTMGQIFCSRGRPLENSRGCPVDFTGHPVNSTGRPLEFSRGRPVKFLLHFLMKLAILRQLKYTFKILVDVQ